MREFIKKEIVFCIALVLAVLTAFANPPSASWVQAIDWRTLGMLFCLMAVSEGLKSSGMFLAAAHSLERRAGNTRRLSMMLVAIVFFSSMLFTNDVALLMFVPFTLVMLEKEGSPEKEIAIVVVLETVAANLGSMTTPVGNPQNLFIVSHYELTGAEFFRTILPFSLLSAFLLAIAFFVLVRKARPLKGGDGEGQSIDKRKTAIYCIFLLLALLSVFHVLDWRILLALELACLVIFDRQTLRKVDYILLLTFVCFFIFSGNIRAIDAVESWLRECMASAPVATSALASQVVSNVPAAILLSPLTDDFTGPLVGTNIGGLGTPVASLASLISLKFHFARPQSRKGEYMLIFSILNFAMLAILALAALVLC